MFNVGIIAPLAGIIGLLFAYGIYRGVMRCHDGNERMREIAGQIELGAMTFLKAEYQILVVFVLIITGLLFERIYLQRYSK